MAVDSAFTPLPIPASSPIIRRYRMEFLRRIGGRTLQKILQMAMKRVAVNRFGDIHIGTRRHSFGHAVRRLIGSQKQQRRLKSLLTKSPAKSDPVHFRHVE